MAAKSISEDYSDVIHETPVQVKSMEAWAPQRWLATLKRRRADAALTDNEREEMRATLALAERRELAGRDAIKQNEKIGYLLDVGIPARLAEMLANGEDSRDTIAAHALRESLNAGRTMIVLSGPVGTGKTVAAARVAADHWRSAYMVTAFGLRRIDAYESEEVGDLERSAVVVLDDLGSEYQDDKGFMRFLTEGIINARYDNGLLTIITTNLPAEQFAARYGERIADRIRETGCFVEIAADSLRHKPKHDAVD